MKSGRWVRRLRRRVGTPPCRHSVYRAILFWRAASGLPLRTPIFFKNHLPFSILTRPAGMTRHTIANVPRAIAASPRNLKRRADTYDISVGVFAPAPRAAFTIGVQSDSLVAVVGHT
jgi:hypothetical protein